MVMDVLMVGAGEYTAGYVPTKDGAASDKPAGVIAITLFDLRRLGKVRRLVMCDAGGSRFPAIRQTLKTKIADEYRDMDITLETFPSDDISFAPESYREAIKNMKKGDMVTIFTPDDTHFDIAMAAIERGLHVLVAKPAVQLLEHHRTLCQAARRNGVLVAVEFHKRFDPIYADAHDRIRNLGAFSYFSSTMTQPKKQLETFAGWAGKSSDISYYLNSHHIDFLVWSVGVTSRPIRVVAMASRGEASRILGREMEDTITLMVEWANEDMTRGTSVHMASWIAPPGDCHTQQNFYYGGGKGELRVDQAHRGYSGASEENGYSSLNPLYMRYTPDGRGYFGGQQGYGYRSLSLFLEAAEEINNGLRTTEQCDKEGILATIHTTLPQTAILEAGRRSLDSNGSSIFISYDEKGFPIGFSTN